MLTRKTGQVQARFVLKDDEYAEDVRPGCIGISFQRGNAEWLDEKYVVDCKLLLLEYPD